MWRKSQFASAHLSKEETLNPITGYSSPGRANKEQLRENGLRQSDDSRYGRSYLSAASDNKELTNSINIALKTSLVIQELENKGIIGSGHTSGINS